MKSKQHRRKCMERERQRTRDTSKKKRRKTAKWLPFYHYYIKRERQQCESHLVICIVYIYIQRAEQLIWRENLVVQASAIIGRMDDGCNGVSSKFSWASSGGRALAWEPCRAAAASRRCCHTDQLGTCKRRKKIYEKEECAIEM